MLAHVLALGHDGEIIHIVVQLIAIDVMDDLARQERTSDFFLSYNAMLVATQIFAIGPPFAASALSCAVLLAALLRDAPIEFRSLSCLPNAGLRTETGIATFSRWLENVSAGLAWPRIVLRLRPHRVALACN